MAKQQVTEEDLAAGLKSLGGLGGLGASGARRDSPFGSDHVRKPAQADGQAVSVPPPVGTQAVKTLELKGRVEAPVDAVTPEVKPPPVKVMPVARAKVTSKRSEVEETPKKLSTSKVDTLTERVTVLMSAEMRDEVNDLARRLQRQRREKGERITGNTVIRVAVQHFLDTAQLQNLEGCSNEEDLLLSAMREFTK